MRWVGWVVAVSLTVVSETATSQNLLPYVVSERDLGQGGEPVSLQEMAEDPARWLRSEEAARSLVEHIIETSGERPAPGRGRLLSGASLVPCEGSILTAGLTPTGEQRWFIRPCHEGEQLVSLGGRVVASQGCWNPVYTPPSESGRGSPRAGWAAHSPPLVVSVPLREDRPVPVTEPSVWVILAGGLAGLLIWRSLQ